MRSLLFGLALSVAMSGAAVHAADSPEAEKMAQQIAKQLKESGQLKNYRVGVKYEDGVAWLLGSVTSPSQKRIAEELAGNCAGVDHVVCRLEVTGQDAEPAPIEIQPAINEQPIAALEEAKPLQRQPQPAQLVQSSRMTAPRRAQGNMPVPYAMSGGRGVQQANFANQQAGYCPDGSCMPGTGGMMGMGPQQAAPTGAAVSYENPQLPGYAWPTYAASPNYAALTYPKQYSASAWPYIGPFYPYPQVPLGWRKVSLEWDDGWWFLDFSDSHH